MPSIQSEVMLFDHILILLSHVSGMNPIEDSVSNCNHLIARVTFEQEHFFLQHVNQGISVEAMATTTNYPLFITTNSY